MNNYEELSALAEAYASALDEHRKNPRDHTLVKAWDDATSALSQAISGKEEDIIAELLTERSAQPQKPVVLLEPHAHLIWIQAGRGPDDYWDDVEVSRSEEDRCCDGSERYAVYSEFEVKAMLDAANIPYEVNK